MKKAKNIRNVVFISDFKHGCSTLLDSLLVKCGILSQNEWKTRFVYLTKDHAQQEQKMSIKASYISLYYQPTNKDDKQIKHSYLFNVIDTPGHSSFSAEATSSFVLSDGAVIVVDSIQSLSLSLQTEKLLQCAVSQDIVPILFMDKLDKMFLELQLTYQQTYNILNSSIDRINVLYSLHKRIFVSNHGITPKYGNVGFGSGLYQWAFTLQTFAEMYSSKFGLRVSKLMTKLWGNNYWDGASLRWVKMNKTGTLLRAFSEFIIKPIKILHDAIINGADNVYVPIIQSLGLDISFVIL